MIVGVNPLLLKTRDSGVQEDWGAYPSTWSLLDYRLGNAISLGSGSDVSVSGNRVQVASFGTNSAETTYYGPIITLPVDVGTGDFTLTFDIRFQSTASGVGQVAVGLINSTTRSGSTTQDASYAYFADAAPVLAADYRALSRVGGSQVAATSIDNDGDSSEQNVDITIERVGTTITFTASNQAPYNSSNTATSAVDFDYLVVSFGRLAGSSTISNMSVGPITLEV